jgi:hypothetical protein
MLRHRLTYSILDFMPRGIRNSAEASYTISQNELYHENNYLQDLCRNFVSLHK